MSKKTRLIVGAGIMSFMVIVAYGLLTHQIADEAADDNSTDTPEVLSESELRPNPVDGFTGYIEERLAEQIKDQGFSSYEASTPGNVGAFLRSALGIVRAWPGAAEDVSIEVTGTMPYGRGELDSLAIADPFYGLTGRALYARQPAKPRDAVVVLHGHGGSANHAFGLRSNNPTSGAYMREVASELFEMGYDVIAPDITRRWDRSAALNQKLLLKGQHIAGLWTELTCKLIDWLRTDGGYESLIVYGISNGGQIAEFVAIVCDAVDQVIVDDIINDWRRLIWTDQIETDEGILEFGPTQSQVERRFMFAAKPYLVHYLAPLHHRLTFLDLIGAARSPLVHIRSEERLMSLLPAGLNADMKPGVDWRAPLNLVFKLEDQHVAELPLIRSILRGETNLRGLSMSEQAE